MVKNPQKNRGTKLAASDGQNAKNANDSDGLTRGTKLAFLPPHGGRPAIGHDPAFLIDLCRTLQRNLLNGELRDNQRHLGVAASELLCALAGVGLDAMIDEACGYQPQETRHDAFDRWFRELRNFNVKRILGNKLIASVCRLHGWEYEPGRSPPLAMLRFVGKFYHCVLGDEKYARFKAVCDAAKSPEEARNRMYQFLAENPLVFTREMLLVAEAYAKNCRSPLDFWNSMYTWVWGHAFQLPMDFRA